MASVSEPRTEPNRAILGIEKLVSTIAQKEGYKNFTLETTPISTKGANFLGDIYLVDVVEAGKETLKLFAKATNTPEQARVMVKANNIYEREVFVYTIIADTYHELQKRHNVPEHKRFKFPKYYGSNLVDLEESLVLENLQAQGFVLHDRLKPLPWEYAKVGVEEMAKFHALSFALEKENPELFDKLVKNNDSLFSDRDFEGIAEIVFKSLPNNLALIESEHRPKVQKYFDENRNGLWGKNLNPISKHSVLVHGDYRMSNILVRYQDKMISSLISKYAALSNGHHGDKNNHVQNEESSIVSLKPVDYQTVYYGCPLNDLIYFLFSGTDEEFRRLHFEQIIEHYHNSLADHLKLLSRDINDIYPKSTFYFELKDKLMYSLEIAVVLLSGVLVDADANVKLEDYSTMEQAAKMPQPVVHNTYTERLNGIVSDLVRWGLLK